MAEKSKEIRIELSDEMAAGKYANLAMIAHSENEFIMDFIFIHPPKGKVIARVITSPSHAKRVAAALAENVNNYEKKFGEIKPAKEPPPQIGLGLSKN
jgi:hypothetical protein